MTKNQIANQSPQNMHTPGPWVISETGTLPIFIGANEKRWKDYERTYVAEVGLNPASPESFAEQLANARLIAAAPALLAALESAAQCFEEHSNYAQFTKAQRNSYAIRAKAAREAIKMATDRRE